jgi:hypothetical protein
MINIKDHIDIEDYEPAKEESDQETKTNVNVLNIFMIYYKKLHSVSEKQHLFDGIDTTDNTSTNKPTESLFEIIELYKNSVESDKDMLYDINDDVDINKCRELYMVYINEKPVYLAKYLLTIFNYIATLDNTVMWSIMPLKSV